MTAASPAGTPLIISFLALDVSFLSAVGWIATTIMARVNLQRQIQVASREAWMREFREQVAAILSGHAAFRENAPPLQTELTSAEMRKQTATLDDAGRQRAAEAQKRLDELNDAMRRPYQVIRLLIAEKGLQYATFRGAADRLLTAPTPQAGVRHDEVETAAEQILQVERAVIDAIIADSLTAVWRARAAARWSRFVAWCCNRPRFPDLT